jgi:hypothetical protein
MIHDWLFVGRHCLVDGEPGTRFDQIRDAGFDDSATILAEAIQALVASNQVKANDVALRIGLRLKPRYPVQRRL